MTEHRIAIAVTRALTATLCRVNVHSLACRGKRDHDPNRGHWHRLF